VEWRIEGRDITLTVDLPAGTTAVVELPCNDTSPVLQVDGGQHTWTYELPEGFGRHPVYTMDTDLGTIAADPVAWKAVTEAVAAQVPGIPLDPNDAGGTDITVNGLVDTLELHVPNVPAALRGNLADALAGLALEGSTT
jgi:alpha-L-rhamnosidase